MQQSIKKSADFLEALIEKKLCSLSIPTGLRGFHFIKNAELMILEDGNLIYRLEDEVYPRIANKYFTTSRRVDRAISYAIEISWSCEEENSLKYRYSDNLLMPTNREFFTFITEQIKCFL